MGVLSAVGLEEEVDHVDGADTEDIDARKEVDQRRAKEMTHRRDGVMTMNSRAWCDSRALCDMSRLAQWRRRLLIQEGQLRSNLFGAGVFWKVQRCELCCDSARCVIGGCYRHDSHELHL